MVRKCTNTHIVSPRMIAFEVFGLWLIIPGLRKRSSSAGKGWANRGCILII
jgi:hypothetical protein